MISIHAPVKGATLLFLFKILSGEYFNPRSREGSDYYTARRATCVQDFNPRSREGSDDVRRVMLWVQGISIHAPVKGATDGHGRGIGRRGISIHAPVKGATGLIIVLDPLRADFNPRSREGSDSPSPCNADRSVYFNPRLMAT